MLWISVVFLVSDALTGDTSPGQNRAPSLKIRQCRPRSRWLEVAKRDRLQRVAEQNPSWWLPSWSGRGVLQRQHYKDNTNCLVASRLTLSKSDYLLSSNQKFAVVSIEIAVFFICFTAYDRSLLLDLECHIKSLDNGGIT